MSGRDTHKLSRLDFLVLDALADGSEPFSMIYQDVVSLEPSARDVRIIANSLIRLMSAGLIGSEPSGGAREPDADTLAEHYHDVDKELGQVERPFYYS